MLQILEATRSVPYRWCLEPRHPAPPESDGLLYSRPFADGLPVDRQDLQSKYACQREPYEHLVTPASISPLQIRKLCYGYR